MITPEPEHRSDTRRALDEQIASEAPLQPPVLAADETAAPLEEYLARRAKPVAVAGVVENGMVRPLDPAVKLTEHARVIIVASQKG